MSPVGIQSASSVRPHCHALSKRSYFKASTAPEQMLRDSFSNPADLPTSLLCFTVFTGYRLSRESSTNSCYSALTSTLIRPPLHSFMAAPLCLSVQNTILPNKVQWSALFLLPGSKYTTQLPVSVRHAASVSSFNDFSKFPFFSQIYFSVPVP